MGLPQTVDYMSFFFAFSTKKPFQVLRVGSKPLPLKAEFSSFPFHVAFPTQLLESGEQLKVLYGAGDAVSRSWTVSQEDVEDDVGF